jgi:hypothetical protein
LQVVVLIKEGEQNNENLQGLARLGTIGTFRSSPFQTPGTNRHFLIGPEFRQAWFREMSGTWIAASDGEDKTRRKDSITACHRTELPTSRRDLIADSQ